MHVYIYPVINKLTSLEYVKNAPASGQFALFTRNWPKLKSSLVLLNILKGYELPFLDSELFKTSPPPTISIVQEDILLID